MLIGGVIAFCVVLFVIAVVWPRGSRQVERGGDAPLRAGQNAAADAPGKLGRWLQKPFSSSRKAVHGSGSSGRKTRFKLPL
jgi:Family of unknown function (DUF6411)